MSESPTLVWGSTSLVRDETSGLNWWIEASADGTNWGNPEAVVTQIKSHLQDGSLAQVTSEDNRQATIRLQVCAYDYEGLAQGEAALVAEANVSGYSTLTWSPNRLLAKPTVFDVVYATIAFDFDDLNEVKRTEGTILQRKYALTLECLPFGRDDTEVTVTGNSVGSGGSGSPTETPINDCSSAAGWLGGGSSVSASGGAVSAAPSTATGFGYVAFLSRFVSLNVSNGQLVYWDWMQNGTAGASPTMQVGAAGSGPSGFLSPAYTTALASGYTRSYFQIPAEYFPVAAIGFGLMHSTAADGDNRLFIDQVTQTTGVQGAGASGSLRQRTTTVKVGGSARTPARLLLTAPADLGSSTLIYTRTAGSSFQPPLRPWGDPPDVPTANTFSGGLSTYLQALIPATALLQGTYNLVARTTGTGAVNYLVEMALADTGTTSKPYDSDRTSVAGSVATTGGLIDLGLFTLPPFGIDSGATYKVRVALSGTGSVQFDEGWLFDVDRGALSIIDSTYLKSVEIRTPDLQLPEPSYWGTFRDDGGPEAGQRVRIDSRVQAGEHYFDAGLVDIFTACLSDTSSVSASFYRRHHTHATEIDA